MALRNGHGLGAGVPRIEVLPANELPAPIAGTTVADRLPVRRKGDWLFNSESAKAIGRLGGIAKANRIRLVDSLGIKKLADDSSFLPYQVAAEEFVSHHREALARQAGGELGPAPSTMVASAGLQLAASRWAFDKGASGGDPLPVDPKAKPGTSAAEYFKLGSTLANDSRQNLLAAYELATREAQARRASAPQSAHVALTAALTHSQGRDVPKTG